MTYRPGLALSRTAFLAGLLFACACGSGATGAPPAAPNAAPAEPAPGDEPTAPSAKNPSPAEPALAASPPAAEAAPSAPPAGPSAPPAISFPPGASVEAATKAVPQGVARLNMSRDALESPLLDLRRYEKCKVPRTTKVALNVAVYDGVAVGVDVITKPKNAKIDACLDDVVRHISWDKVPSLNQVSVRF